MCCLAKDVVTANNLDAIIKQTAVRTKTRDMEKMSDQKLMSCKGIQMSTKFSWVVYKINRFVFKQKIYLGHQFLHR